jgi:hypothetical protein
VCADLWIQGRLFLIFLSCRPIKLLVFSTQRHSPGCQIVRLFNKVQQAATDLMNRLWTAINKFLEALGITGNCGITCLFRNLLVAIQKLPSMAVDIFNVIVSLEDYVGPNATKVSNVNM